MPYEWSADAGRSVGSPEIGRGVDPAPSWDVKGCLKRRKKLILGIAAAAMALATVTIFSLPKTYQATSAIIVQGDGPDPSRLADASREPVFGPETLGSEVELLQSDGVLTEVARRLNLTEDAELNPPVTAWSSHLPKFATAIAAPLLDPVQQWTREMMAQLKSAETTDPSMSAADRTLGATLMALRSRLSIGPVGLSRVIHITYSSDRPEMAARVANEVANAYTATLVANKAHATSEAHVWIERRLSDLRDKASRSAQAYENFRYANDLARGKDSTISQEQLTQVSTQLTQARQTRADAESLLAQTKGGSTPELDLLATATGSQLLPRLHEQQAQATARMAEMGGSDGSNLPRMVAARAQVADISRSIAAERDRIRQTLQAKAVMARQGEENLNKTLNEMKSHLGRSDGDSARMQGLERDAAADRELYTTFLARARQTDPEVNYQAAGARLLSPATPPLSPSSPNKKLLLPFSLAFSLGLGAVAAIVRENSSRGLRSMADVQRTMGQVSLGLIPLVSRNNRNQVRSFEEAIAGVLARVVVPSTTPMPCSILVTSSVPDEGKTKTSIALAAAATARGMQVLLVDADLRSRSLSAAAGLDRTDRNLAQLLRGTITADEAIHFNPAWGFAVMAAGSAGGSPMNVIGNGNWEATLRNLERMYDLVIIDSPPVLIGGDTWILARAPKKTIVLSRWGSTPQATLELAIDQLVTAQAKIAGIVLTMVASREHATYGYGDSVVFSHKLNRHYDGPRRLS